MDDDRLASELERRAAGASPRPDWAQRDLLPAVWREIDARPVLVVTSRWSPIAGIAMLVVALLVVAVAAPRSVPSPSAATGSSPPAATGSSPPIANTSSPTTATTSPPAQPAVLTSTEFAALLAQDALLGETVLVEGSIGISVRRGPACVPYQPEHHCFLGTLEGADPPIGIWTRMFPTTEFDSGATWEGPGVDWPWWTGPGAPLSGVLALSVAEDGRVDLIGPVRQAGGGLNWTVAEATAAATASVEPEEVVLVDGWLTQLGGETLCLPPPPNAVAGLPSLWCGNPAWLFDEPVDANDPNNPDFDSSSGLPVQNNAYDEIIRATARAPVPPFRATYAVARRLFTGCGADRTCWHWAIVARVDVRPERNPEPTPSPQVRPSESPATPRAPSPSSVPIARTIDCPDSNTSAGLVQIEDHTGLVASCAAGGAEVPVDDTVTLGTDSALVVTWMAPCAVDPLDTRIELWYREPKGGPSDPSRFQPPYLLVVNRSHPTEPYACLDAISGRQARIQLEQPISPADVELFFTYDGIGTDSARAGDGADLFQLEIVADQPEYTVGESIAVTADLLSEDDATVTGLVHPMFGVEQLDGDVRFHPPPVILICPRPTDLAGGVPLEESSPWPTSWSPIDPQAGFLDAYVRGGQLMLPAGTYRFYAISSFSIGDTCTGDPVDLKASIVVTVR